MTILKLPNVGDTATLDITGCAVVEGEYGEQVKFEAGDDILFLPKSSADRQLMRLGYEDDGGIVGYDYVIGDTLTFSRTKSTKPGAKPFWDISKAKGNGKPPVATQAPSQSTGGGGNAGNPASAPPVEPPKKRNLGELYLMSAKYILTNVIPLYEEKQIGVSDQAVAAMTATLFIAASKEWTGEKP